jgi:hypothetical protein
MTTAVCDISSSLYKSGESIISNPIESYAVFLVVVLLCAVIEYLFAVANDVQSKFFHSMFTTISEEVLVVGLLSLLLSFGTSLPSYIPQSWCVMTQWTHVCLLLMGFFFVFVLLILCYLTIAQHRSMRKFEMNRINTNISQLSGMDLMFRKAHRYFRICCQAYDLADDADAIFLSDYLLKIQKLQLLALGDLSWKSWLALSTAVVLNASRTRIPAMANLGTNTDLVDIGSYVALMGVVPLGAYLYMHQLLNRRFAQFFDKRLEEQSNAFSAAATTTTNGNSGGRSVANATAATTTADGATTVQRSTLDDPRAFLLWQTPESTMAILQVVFLWLVWYGAVYCLNMMYITFTLTSIYQTIAFVIVAFLPVIVFCALLPRTLFIVSILSSVGSCLDTKLIREIVLNIKGELKEEVEMEDGTAPAIGGVPSSSSGGPAKGKDGSSPAGAGARNVVIRQPPPVIVDEVSLIRLSEHQNGTRGGVGDNYLV